MLSSNSKIFTSTPVEFNRYIIPTQDKLENPSIFKYIGIFLKFNTASCEYKF
ncbi:MAG: hypothetical protein SPL73_03770 [Cyanobacteriota bacterium]|nr:hypothetical protein [Cyanobacteriota bacterium]MDY6358902.1 hypothetical protein [Cyanobacteriota bacterium]MDY6363989.1 hypothetical protein [Cyanobacteriota bacterium]MDY6382958.1 hypothetical protein [Cyanobacteriota bacterium]